MRMRMIFFIIFFQEVPQASDTPMNVLIHKDNIVWIRKKISNAAFVPNNIPDGVWNNVGKVPSIPFGSLDQELASDWATWRLVMRCSLSLQDNLSNPRWKLAWHFRSAFAIWERNIILFNPFPALFVSTKTGFGAGP